jgi:UbiD family decarboxylase
MDGGPYITAGVSVIYDPDFGRNISFHRLMRISKDRLVGRIVENRGTHTAWKKLKEGLPMAVCIGLPPQVLLAAAMSPSKGIDEINIANALAPTPTVRAVSVPLEIPAESELVLEGILTHEMTTEGPFPDLTGTMDGTRMQPIFRVTTITHRRNPIFHALLPAGMEHKNLMGMPREPTIYAAVNEVTRCTGVAITPGGCSWLHAVIQIDPQGPEDARLAVEAAFRGHASLKHVVIVNSDVDILNTSDVEWAIATRFQASRDLMVFYDQPSSSLDPSALQIPGQKARTTKMGLDATIPWDDDPQGFRRVNYEYH